VLDVEIGGKVQRRGQLRRDAKRVRRGRGARLAQGNVERIGRHIFLSQIRSILVHAGGDGRGNRRMRQVDGDQLLEIGDEPMDALGWQIKREQLDGNEAIAIRIERAVDRT
jgi:hypothetical protein